MNLLLDIGNTRIKWGVERSGAIDAGSPIEYKQIDFADAIRQSWIKLNPPQNLAISSVTAKNIATQIMNIARELWPDIKICIAKSFAHGFSVTNAYQQADKLGVDRWLGLIALQHYYPGDSAFVDCGTAITIDYLNNGIHLGGLICPGIQLMKKSLVQDTENLTLAKNQYSVGLSNCTESAIYSGTLYAAAGMIEKTINNLCPSDTVILTGGDAELLAEYLDFKHIIEPEFVLKGLALFCNGEKL
jgi:type III pantothenate kinase